jgi:hypothetical protein
LISCRAKGCVLRQCTRREWNGGAHDLDKGQGDLGVPLLGRLQNNSNQW